MQNCAGCGLTVEPEGRIFCPSCGAEQHLKCVQARGGCTACGVAFNAPGSSPAAPPPLTVGTTPCKQCNHPIPTGAPKCPSCGAVVKKTSSLAIVAAIGCICMVMFVPVMAILAAILVPNFVKARAQGQYTSCKSNLKNIATACEMYSTDNEGRYPHSLAQLTPNYLRIIPNCPAAEHDTYSAKYEWASEPDAFTVYCQGDNHKFVGRREPNYPQYNSYEGLKD